MQHLLITINPTSTSWRRLTVLLNGFTDLTPVGIDLRGMGVNEDWEAWEWTRYQ